LDNVKKRSKLLERQQELEQVMKQLGGARVIEEQELLSVKNQLRALDEATALDGARRAARCSLADFAPRPPGMPKAATAKGN
jgi:hypothetical protein